MKPCFPSIFCLACLIAFCTLPSAHGQEPPVELTVPQVEADVPQVSIESIDARLKELETMTGVDEATVTAAKELYQQAKLYLHSASKLEADAASYKQKIASVADDLKATQGQLDVRPNETVPDVNSKNQAELQIELTQKTADLAKAREQAAQLAGEPSRRQARLLELPQLISKAASSLKTIEEQLKQPPPANEQPVVTAARETNLLAQKQLLQQEGLTYEAEQLFYAATTELLPLQTELLQRQVERLQNETARLSKAVESKRESEIEQLQRRMADQLQSVPDALKPAAQMNVELVEQYVTGSRRLGEANVQLDKTDSALEEIESEFQTSRERVTAVGLNDTLGLMLRTNKSWLASKRRIHQSADGSVPAEIRELQVELFRLQDLLRRASETDSSIGQFFMMNQVPANQHSALRSSAEAILADRRAVLTPMILTKTKLFKTLVDLDTVQRKVVQEIDDYTQYINEHVLWIRSGPVFGSGDFMEFQNAIRWTFQASNWSALRDAAGTAIDTKLGLFLLLALGFLLLGFIQGRLRKSTTVAGETAAAGGCHKMAPTAVALVNTLLMAWFWPFLIVAAGWLLTGTSGDLFVQALARSLVTTGLTIFPFELLRQTCRTDGLADSHYGWSTMSRKYLRSNLRWMIPLLTVLLLLVNIMQYQPSEEFRNVLGRLLMLILLLVTATYLFRILHPNSQIYRGMSARDRQDYWYRFRYLRFVVSMIIVAGLMLFTLGGYYYTTYQIGSRLLQTSALIIFFVVTYETTMRWLLVRRRKMKLEQLAARRLAASRQPDVEQTLGETIKVGALAEPGLDANTVSKQAREILLVVTGFLALSIAWQIWADIFPAVGILNRVELWPVTMGGVVEKVTLQHLLYFTLAIIGTLIAVKNIPGILELLLLRRLPMDAGARYAVATIVRYIIGVIGLLIAFAMLKIQWGQFSWLLAAISVGLGFGLQEIVANFVSGLILLLERPVRIGDIVTIEGTTGVVTKIKMRATTVTNLDQQELVVPNKTLITGSIFNWTLSNVITRITLEVGVAYGSDPEFVQEIMLKAIRSSEYAVSDPPPSVTFETFGDSALIFKVRCCISGPDHKLPAIHSMQVAINKCLAENNIEIPFPQRVIHTAAEKHAEKFLSEPQDKKT